MQCPNGRSEEPCSECAGSVAKESLLSVLTFPGVLHEFSARTFFRHYQSFGKSHVVIKGFSYIALMNKTTILLFPFYSWRNRDLGSYYNMRKTEMNCKLGASRLHPGWMCDFGNALFSLRVSVLPFITYQAEFDF